VTTGKDVAQLAGVSVATVSRALNNLPDVSDDTRAKVLWAAEQLGYRPSRVARRLRVQVSQILGLIVSDVANPFFPSVVRGIEDVAHAHGYTLLLCNSDEDPAKESLYADVLLAEKVAGVITVPTREDSLAYKSLSSHGIPIVVMDRRLRVLDVDTVLVENRKGAYAGVQHLIQLGHRRIGLISGPMEITTGRERHEGCANALSDYGIPLDNSLVRIGDFKQQSGYRQAYELLDVSPAPTAIFVANNLMALGALSAIREKGLVIPRDVAFISFDDMACARVLDPPLTVVAQPTYELGHSAAELLLERIADRTRPTVHLELQTRLIVRESCGQEKKRS